MGNNLYGRTKGDSVPEKQIVQNPVQNKAPSKAAENNPRPVPVENKTGSKPAESNPPPKPVAPAITDHYIYRCAVVGFEGVGKSSFIKRYVNGTFTHNSLPKTPSVEFSEKNDILSGSKKIKLIIMDTPG